MMAGLGLLFRTSAMALGREAMALRLEVNVVAKVAGLVGLLSVFFRG